MKMVQSPATAQQVKCTGEEREAVILTLWEYMDLRNGNKQVIDELTQKDEELEQLILNLKALLSEEDRLILLQLAEMMC